MKLCIIVTFRIDFTSNKKKQNRNNEILDKNSFFNKENEAELKIKYLNKQTLVCSGVKIL